MKEVLLETLDAILTSPTSIKLHIDKVEELLKDLSNVLTDEESMELSGRIKNRVQEEADQAITEKGGIGAFIGATGTGKSKVGLMRIQRVVKSNPKARILVVVPTEVLRDSGWVEEAVKWGMAAVWLKNVEACCYASLNRFMDQEFDLVILDELHRITPSNSVFFNQNKVHSCVGLTAFHITNQEKIAILDELNIGPVYSITLDEGTKLGIVAPFDITVVTVPLEDKEKNVRAGGKVSPFLVTEKSNYSYLNKLVYEKPVKNSFIRRRNFIFNLHSKTEAAKLILKHVIPKNKRTIIFCGRTLQADQVCEHAYHSKRKDTIAFEKFKSGDINCLATVNSVNEGHNIRNIDCGFITQLDSTVLNMIQRIGRTVRFRPGHKSIIIILCAEGTVDTEWAKSALTYFDPRNVRWVTLEEIRTGQKTISFN